MTPDHRLLALDVGNTHAVVGLFEGAGLRRTWRLAADPARTSDELVALLGPLFAREEVDVRSVDGIVGGSVVPALHGSITDAVQRLVGHEVLWVHGGLDLGIPLRVDRPDEVGADRLANAVALRHLYGGPAIAVDLGTATKLDVVNGRGEYLGGAIAPGMGIAAEALAARGAKLRRVPMQVPVGHIGRNTVHAMQSGILWGHVAMVEGLVARMKGEMASHAALVATGGLAPVLAPSFSIPHVVDPYLTLNGLRLIHEQQRRRR